MTDLRHKERAKMKHIVSFSGGKHREEQQNLLDEKIQERAKREVAFRWLIVRKIDEAWRQLTYEDPSQARTDAMNYLMMRQRQIQAEINEWQEKYDNFPELFEKSLQMEAECEHDTKFANGKKLADYTAEFKAADKMEIISIPLFVEETSPGRRAWNYPASL